MRTLTLCWLALLALAVAGVLLGGAGDSPWLLAAVLACAVAKGWLIGERFMGWPMPRRYGAACCWPGRC